MWEPGLTEGGAKVHTQCGADKGVRSRLSIVYIHSLERERTEHIREIETLREECHDRLEKKEELNEELLVECEQLRKEREQNHDKDQVIQRLQAKVEALEMDLLRSGGENLPQATNDMVRAIHCNSHCIYLHV